MQPPVGGAQRPQISNDADPRLSPLRQADFTRLPATVMVTAGFDPLLDEGRAYALAAARAGVPFIDTFEQPADRLAAAAKSHVQQDEARADQWPSSEGMNSNAFVGAWSAGFDDYFASAEHA